jgi:hypothetical protein
MKGATVTVLMACSRITIQSFAWIRTNFRVRKLLNVGVDLALQRRGEKKRPGQIERQILRI